ncbi:hypothetical protein PC116_g17947 [Phytophthora cactorum]|nr:hypothetical protein PC114_g14771 [Phytophthora cactorum]KAG4233871.1 hypothetical protein PC116_g17947 [Phytophthora cactorum]
MGIRSARGGWTNYAERMRDAKLQSLAKRREPDEPSLGTAMVRTPVRTKLTADREASQVMDPLQVLFDSLEAKMFTTGEPDELSPVPVFEHMSFVNDICFGGETFDSCLATLDRLLSRFGKWGLTKSLFIKSKVSFLSHEVSRVGIRADPKKMQAIATLPFPTSKKGM